jgi:hypothetical protein
MSSNTSVPMAVPPSEGLATRESPSRLFVFEPGWRVSIKHGSHREFCYAMAPGQDYYHRLLDGELYVHHGDERLCLSCATRRGVISFEPKLLRNPIDYSLADSSDLADYEPDSDDLD